MFACGVGSNDEQSLASVRGTNIGCPNNRPRCVVPDRGKVFEDNVEPSPEMCGDVFQDNETGSKAANGICDVRPEVPGVFCSKSLTCIREGLAWVAGREDVDRLDQRPVDHRKIANVRRCDVVVSHDLGGP
jgi:hypothetical protein